MKVYVAPAAVAVRFDSKDVVCSSKGFATDDDVFDDTSGSEKPPDDSSGEYEFPIVYVCVLA